MRGKIIALRIALAFAVAFTAWYGTDKLTIETWNSDESRIIEILELDQTRLVGDEGDQYKTVETDAVVLLLTGEKRGESFAITLTQMEGSGSPLRQGSRYLLFVDTFDNGTIQYSVGDMFRLPLVAFFVTLCCGILLALTGMAGTRALAGLLLSISVMLYGFVPMVTSGNDPVLSAAAAVLLIDLLTVACVVKDNGCKIAALLGTTCGALGAFILGWLMVEMWQLTGMAADNAALLSSTIPGFNVKGLLISAVILGSVGAVLDVGISVSASMAELVAYDSGILLSRLWKAGVHVGDEVLGSMINTLILAYIGSSLPMAVLICNAGANAVGILNDSYFAQELLRSLAGTTGLLLTIPFTAGFYTLWVKLKRQSSK